ncbi:14942_t:CDS:2, partial [Racocetra persica]
GTVAGRRQSTREGMSTVPAPKLLNYRSKSLVIKRICRTDSWGNSGNVILHTPLMSETIKLPETPKAQGTAESVKTVLQQHVERRVDEIHPPLKEGMGNRQP